MAYKKRLIGHLFYNKINRMKADGNHAIKLRPKCGVNIH